MGLSFKDSLNKVKENNNDIYDYLLNREFKNFIPPVNSQEESFEIFTILENVIDILQVI